MAISDWPAHQRPRERLLKSGPTSLSDAELLALVLRVGVTGKSAVTLGEELLLRFGSLRALFHASAEEFASLPGLGPAKFALFQAVYELARRATAEQLRKGVSMTRPAEVEHYLQLLLGHQAREVFLVLYLDVRHRLLGYDELFHGSLTRTSVYPREVVKAALARNAAAVILAHNHPSGEAQPSEADRQLTDNLQAALALVDVRVLDHIIVGNGQVYSFASHGLI